MKLTLCIAFLILLFILGTPVFLSAKGAGDEDLSHILNVYCYDTFRSEWGPGPTIARAFTDKTGIEVNLHAPGDAVTVLNQLILEKTAPRADVVIGLDNSLLDRAVSEELLLPYHSPKLADIPNHLIFDTSYHLLPYDYGYFTINYDSMAMENTPVSLEELTNEEYRNQLILMDPRTSTPGLGFLLWTIAVYGDDWIAYWDRLKPSILTITDSWSQGYALYTAGEAPMVLSYGTSPVYHAEYEETDRYKALEFSDGHIRQIEGMGIVKGTKNQNAAEAFIDFMLEIEAQNTLAMSNIMLPVNQEVHLPPSFDVALRPKHVLDSEVVGNTELINALIDRWVEVFAH